MPHAERKRFIGLERHIRGLIRAHEQILDLLKSPNLAEGLERLSNADFRREVAADPMAAARKAGLHIPEQGASVYLHEFVDGWEVEVHLHDEHSLLIAGFNNVKGFYVR